MEVEMRVSAAQAFAAVAVMTCVASPVRAQWTAKMEAGVVAARGNSDSDTSNLKLKVARKFKRWLHTLDASGVYAADDIGATSQRWSLREQSDYEISDKGFWFGSGRYEEDRFSGFNYQSTYGTGLGWRFFDDPITKLSAQIGGGYKVVRRRDSLSEDGLTFIRGEREEELIAQGTVDFEHQLTATTTIFNKLLVESGGDNTFTQNDLSLQVKILGALALAVGYSVRYNTNPPPDFTTTDTLTTLNLVYELE
jgi:putative salt-induced outer membrane protein